jgi:hypothetical protein
MTLAILNETLQELALPHIVKIFDDPKTPGGSKGWICHRAR